MIRLHFPKLACKERRLEPASVAVPFPQGALFNLSGCRVTDEKGIIYPGQFRPTAVWPDGSVKWLLVHMEADLPANKGIDYYLDIHSDKVGFQSVMQVTDTKIDTGALQIGLSKSDEALFEYIHTPYGSFSKEEISPFRITDKQGRVYTAGAGEKGWEIIESGPVRAMVRTRGRHLSEEGSYFDYKITIYAYAGKPWIDLEYCVTNTESGEPLKFSKAEDGLTVSEIASMSLKIRPTAIGEAQTYGMHSTVKNFYHEGEKELLVDENFLRYAVNEQNPEVFYGTLYGDWRDSEKGVAVSIYQAQQNFPKRIAVSREGIDVDLIPEATGAVEFIEGVAKTHRIQMLFHSADADREWDISFRSLQYQLPDKPILEPEVYEASGIFEDIFNRKINRKIEEYLDKLCGNRSRAFGMMHWGDNPDGGYTDQGRGADEVVWINGEYDIGHALYLYYITHRSRHIYGAMKCATEHILDVDICHSSKDPGRMGGHVAHSARHVTGHCGPSHEWVEGLLDYYHETGDPDVLEIAIGVGKNVTYLLDKLVLNQPLGVNVSAREGGWAMIALLALYRETGDEYFMGYCERIVKYFFDWEKEMGAFLAQYTMHSFVRTPFMISVGIVAMYRLYQVRPTEELKGLILRVAEDMVENCISEFTGLFLYKEFPSVNISVLNTMPLGALVHAYQLSGDVKFLKYGIPTFEDVLHNIPAACSGAATGRHCIIRGASGSSNKTMAANTLNILMFYKALADNNLLSE